MWKKREKVDNELLFTKFEHIDYNWLFKGEESKLKVDGSSLPQLMENTIDEDSKDLIQFQRNRIKELQREIIQLKKDAEPTDYMQRVAEPSPKLGK